MNKIYRCIWNRALGAWIAAPETARTKSGAGATAGVTMPQQGSRAAKHPIGAVLALAAAGLLLGLPEGAHATCTSFNTGGEATCSSAMAGVTTTVTNLTLTMDNTAVITAAPMSSSAVTMSGSNATFVNRGTIDAAALAGMTQPISGLTIGNANNSLLNITNHGIINGVVLEPHGALLNTTGMALDVRNGSGLAATTTIVNDGNIGSSDAISYTNAAGDAAVVAVRGGGKVNMTNSGNITGRVAFESSAAGNIFTNAGLIIGSVSLGEGGGNNSFIAITGSQVQKGLSVQGETLVTGTRLNYAAAGVVDGGAGGSNTLFLQNAVGGGSGTGGSGTIDAANYRNFSHLEVSSGTWTLLGTLLNGASTSTKLTGGVLSVDNPLALGLNAISANGGGLQAGGSGVALTNAVTIGTDGFTVSGNRTLILDGIVSGTGRLKKEGNGALSLNGANTYEGGTELAGGSLYLGNAGALGTGRLLVSGAGSLETGAAMQLATPIELNQSLTLLVNNYDITLAGAITGTSGLAKDGHGTAILAENNNYSGTTVIRDGILRVGAGGTKGTLGAGGVVNDGTLILDRSDNVAVANTITGGGLLVMAGSGSTTLAGINAYTGGTEIRSGKVVVAQDANLGGAASGVMLNGGTLASVASFDMTRSVTVAQPSVIDVAANTRFGLGGLISGSGALTKQGEGSLVVSGDSSGFSGGTLISAGALEVAAGGKLGGTLTLASGTQLRGAGQVGSTTLQNGASLAPGQFASPLTVAGDLTFKPGSTYQVVADPASSASARVNISGAANLAGAVIHVGPEAGFASTRQYTILSANAINGKFDTVSSNYAYVTPTLGYSTQAVTLQLERKQVDSSNGGNTGNGGNAGNGGSPSRQIAFADAARTGNQRAVANALDSLPSGSALHEYILTLPEGAPAAAFSSLSGEAHASVATSLAGSSTTTRTLPLSHLRANLGAGMRPGAPTAQSGGTLSASALPSSNAQPAWAELIGNWQTQNATDNTSKVRQHTGGVFAGVDHGVGNGWRIGGAVGYTDSKIRVDDLASKADVSGYSATLYGGKSFETGAGKLNLLVGTSYTWHDVSTERYATVAGASQKLTADYGANTTQLFTELGYAMALSDRATLEPFAGLAWSDLRTRGFSESGGSAALRGQSSNDQQTTSTLGVRAQTDFMLAGIEGRLQATLGWRHAFGDLLPQSSVAFDGGQAFTVSGSPIARNAALAEFGAEVAVSRSASLGLNYSGQYGGGNREHAGSLNMRWRY